MWARLDDGLFDHPKLAKAGGLIGSDRDGLGLALGFYVAGLLWASKHLTDGHLPQDIVVGFPHAKRPLVVADALTKAGLWHKNGDGYDIHDFCDYNPSAAKIKKRLRADRERKKHRE